MLFFFFKQKTAYEMRISDWSSDVCSSDLRGRGRFAGAGRPEQGEMLAEHGVDEKRGCHVHRGIDGADPHMRAVLGREYLRTEERRVGKECVRTFRYRWWPEH